MLVTKIRWIQAYASPQPPADAGLKKRATPFLEEQKAVTASNCVSAQPTLATLNQEGNQITLGW
jgi:hypothetical protein